MKRLAFAITLITYLVLIGSFLILQKETKYPSLEFLSMEDLEAIAMNHIPDCDELRSYSFDKDTGVNTFTCRNGKTISMVFPTNH